MLSKPSLAAKQAAARKRRALRLPTKVRAQLRIFKRRHEIEKMQKAWVLNRDKEMVIRQAVGRAKGRAKSSGRDFDPEIKDFLLRDGAPTHCLCCAKEFDYSSGKGRLLRAPSLDRLVNSGGYTKENTRVICSSCNTLKNCNSLEDLKNLVRYIEGELEVNLVSF